MPPWTSGNRIQTLIDGEEIFSQVKADLLSVDPDGFIYLAFWQFSRGLVLDVNHPQHNLGYVLEQQARNGVPIRLLLWDSLTTAIRSSLGLLSPAGILSLTQLEPLFLSVLGESLYQRLTQSSNVDDNRQWVHLFNRALGRSGADIILKIATYPDPGFPNGPCELGAFVLGSHHQKLVIVNKMKEDGGRHLVSYVLGTNALNEYQDTPEHRRYYPPPPRSNLRSKPWHDLGVKVEGPAANQVEAEFIRRWNLRTSSHIAPCGHISWFDPGIRARHLITNSRTPQIRQNLTRCIDNTTRSIYAEDQFFFNRRLFDHLITAYLASEIRGGRGSSLKIALLTNGPEEFVSHGISTPMEIFRYINFKNLELCTCDDIYDRSRRQTISRQFGEDWRLLPNLGNNRWNLNALYFQSQSRGRVYLRNTTRIRGGIRPAYIWSKDARRSIYVHSKVTVIDDHVTFIGSANYSVRSMEYDSEANMQVENDLFSRNLREQLFEEMLGVVPRGSPELQFRVWHETAAYNARRRSGRRPVSGNVCLVKYPDDIPNITQIIRRLNRIAGVGAITIPSLGPILALFPSLRRRLQQLHGSPADAAFSALLEELYHFC